ncbi:hypothetical protein TeGR_g76 [Tetraparma gracilis]|jgi:Ras-related protein Rab-8A|uniref:Uncharacterized protein n=1 Tax=Tetraparma gracilis TaxID=2962635 RepID=A0ABQ6MER9_9STRA|nr:hypothetical protein TeGR_g76 [Tetraparma gracilis]
MEEKTVSTEEGQKLADEYGIQFWEASAKNDINVEQSFISIAKAVKDRLIKDGVGGPSKGTFKPTDVKNKQAGKGCC